MNERSTVMRIAMLYTPLVTAGGAERQFLEEVRLLRQRGHDVRVLTFRLGDDALMVDGVDCDHISVLRTRGGWIGEIVALRRALRAIRPDLLVSHTSPELTWLATRGSSIPYVQYHNSPPFYIGGDANPYMASSRYRRTLPRIVRDVAGYADFAGQASIGITRRLAAELRTFLKHRALRGARAIVVPSQRTMRELRLLHGVEATVVRGCLPSSIVPRNVTPVVDGAQSNRRLRVLSVCRLDAVKRIDLLIRSFAHVLRDVPDAELVIGGKGPEAEALAAIVRELRIEDRVRFVGYVPEGELRSLYESAEVFAAPAMADFNIAPYEALAAGCRVVWTTEMETDSEIGSSGQVFVAAPEAAAFAAAIVEALRAPADRRADLSGMTWEARGARIDELFHAAAGLPATELRLAA